MSRENRLFLFMSFVIFALFIAIIFKVYQIQIVRHEALENYSRHDEVIKTIKSKRGSIFDTNGEFLAVSEPKVDIAVDSAGIVEKNGMALILSKILNKNPKDVLKVLQKKGHFYYLKKNADYQTVKQLKEQASLLRKRLKELDTSENVNPAEVKMTTQMISDFRFVIYQDGYKRVYPQGKMLANVLGFVQRSEDIGLEGIEMSYDKYLVGQERKIKRFSVPGSGEVAIEVEKEVATSPGANLFLTIDSRIQFIAEEELSKMMEETNSKWGAVVIMDPASGKILAMANYPTYNPEKYFKYKFRERRNYAIANLFEPGSTFKVFSLIAVMNENLVKPGELIFGENGRFMYGRRWVRDTHPHEYMTLRDIVINSSNIGTLKLADRLASENLYNYLLSFGFGQKTKINLPGESNSELRHYKKWYPIDKANISFGQGVASNMVQNVRAYASIYNGGVLWQPTIVDRIEDSATGKIIFQTVPEPKRISFNYNSDKAMVKMLEGVVEEGTAKRAQIAGLRVGGKTGTSQKFDFEKGSYSFSKVVCSFIGAVPSNDPAMVMMVVIDEPEGKHYGGTVAAPVFRNIAVRSLPLLGVMVDGETKEKDVVQFTEKMTKDITSGILNEEEGEEITPLSFVKVPNFKNMDTTKAVQSGNRSGLNVVVSGFPSGIVAGQYPESGEIVPFGTVVTIETEGEEDESI
jgi:cell division protein FtsI (penicillin-binding protein 3)